MTADQTTEETPVLGEAPVTSASQAPELIQERGARLHHDGEEGYR